MNPHKRARHHRRGQPGRAPGRERWADGDGDADDGPSSAAPAFPPAAFVTAYEAQLVFPTPDDLDYRGRWRGRDLKKALMPWAGDEKILADRYDLVHLLDALPSGSSASALPASAYNPFNGRAGQAASDDESDGSAWSLPSDEGELWALDDDAAREAYVRDKRRKWVDGLREARLREREAEDADAAEATQAAEPEDAEVPEQVATLMAHTARSLARSPDPTVLELKIMTHHAADARFAFLRGQWAHAWARAKVDAARALRAERGLDKETGLGGLMGGYGSGSGSDSDGDDEAGGEAASGSAVRDAAGAAEAVEAPPPPPSAADIDKAVHAEMVAEAARQAERRARAAKWKAERAKAAS